MENDLLSPYNLCNKDPLEYYLEPYLYSEDFSTKNFRRDILPYSLYKNYDENASYTSRNPEFTRNWYYKGYCPYSIYRDSKGDFLLYNTCNRVYYLLYAGISTTPNKDKD